MLYQGTMASPLPESLFALSGTRASPLPEDVFRRRAMGRVLSYIIDDPIVMVFVSNNTVKIFLLPDRTSLVGVTVDFMCRNRFYRFYYLLNSSLFFWFYK